VDALPRAAHLKRQKPEDSPQSTPQSTKTAFGHERLDSVDGYAVGEGTGELQTDRIAPDTASDPDAEEDRANESQPDGFTRT